MVGVGVSVVKPRSARGCLGAIFFISRCFGIFSYVLMHLKHSNIKSASLVCSVQKKVGE